MKPATCATWHGRVGASRSLLAIYALVLVLWCGGVAADEGVLCVEGEVTYCGLSNDGGARAPPGQNRFVEGPNWACENAGMNPTDIAPNCWDQASCEALQVRTPPHPALHDLCNTALEFC